MSESVGNAYLNVLPQVDEGAARSAGSSAGESIGESIQTGLSAKAVVIGNVITDAIRTAAGAAVDFGRDIASGIYEGYSANEQLVGGMQKLFGDDAQTVIANANAAFATAGMSANDYMENVTGIAASLVNSVGGDTEKAAELANTAMLAMSDNVNTFGTDAQSVQNAVMGLAKGNYSMLDNLSLGFAGNQQGMVDLINASGVLGEELTDTSQLADVGFGTMIEAIQQVQSDMGIAGTTAKEAMGTIEGSATATKAAWDNVLTSIGSGDASQVKAAATGLVDSLFGTINTETGAREGGLIENLTGLASRAFTALGAALPGMLDSALSALPPEIGGPLKDFFDTIGKVAAKVAPVVSKAISGLVKVIGTVAPVVAPLLPIITAALGAVKIVGVITSIVGAISGFIGMAGTAIGMIGSLPGLIAVVSTALGGPIAIIAAVVGAIVAFIATNEEARTVVVNVWNAIKTGVTNAVLGLATGVMKTWDKIRATVMKVTNTLKGAISSAWNGIKSTVTSIAGNISSAVQGKFQSIVDGARNKFNAVKSAITGPLNAAKDAVSGAMSRIKSIISGTHLSLPHFKLPHISVSGGKAPFGIGGKGSLPSFSVKWYGKGGYVNEPTLFGAGEKGGEFIWPSRAPYLDRYADALADRIGGGGVNVYLTYNGSGDADELVSTLTRELRVLRMTGAI